MTHPLGPTPSKVIAVHLNYRSRAVERAVYPEFTRRLAERAERVRVGVPSDPATEVGALVHPDHYARVLHYVETGAKEARLVAGGRRGAGVVVWGRER